MAYVDASVSISKGFYEFGNPNACEEIDFILY